MNPTQRKWLYHSTPGWIDDAKEIFFVTVCTKSRSRELLISEPIARQLLDSIAFRHKNSILFAHQFLIMPDHVHGLLRLGPNATSLKEVMRDWKSWTAKRLGIQWQRGFFEHRIRSDESLDEKYEYIRNNPVRAGLVDSADEWEWKMEAFLG